MALKFIEAMYWVIESLFINFQGILNILFSNLWLFS